MPCCEHPNPAECPNHGVGRVLSNKIGDLSIDAFGLSRKAEAIASDASYTGSELQRDGLLSIAGELRCLASEIEALR